MIRELPEEGSISNNERKNRENSVLFFRRDGIVAVTAPGIAGSNAFYPEVASVQQSVNLQSLNEIRGAGRGVAAARREKRGDAGFVEADE